MRNFNTIICFTSAAALGAFARYFVLWFLTLISNDAPVWGVFIVNILGSFGFGYFYNKQKLRLILLTGFMGSFTTFSSYIFDMFTFIQNGAWGLLIFNGFLQIFVGFFALRFGLNLAVKYSRT